MTGGDQLELPVGPYRNGGLFSERFLAELLPEWPEFLAADAAHLLESLHERYVAEREALAASNEAQTEELWVQPVLEALGFHYTVQAGLRVGSGRRQPDYALFLSDQGRRDAAPLEGIARYESAVCVADAKRFDRPLERRRAEGALSEDPVAQIIHYVSVTRRPWGLLTNGRVWRLYALERDLLGGAFYEVDLVRLLEAGDARAFRWFSVLFSASAFQPGPDGRSLLERALGESKANAVTVGDALERQVFGAVPLVAGGLLGSEGRDVDALAAAFDNALVLLYRLLFCLYAEARGLLPVENRHYFEYSLRKQKEGLAADIAGGRVFSAHSDDLYNDLRALFRIVDRGDEALGVAEYNGGLFSAQGHPYFEGRSVPDRALAPALDGLYRVGGEFVDYRDLSVRHLGTIYERLLDYRLAEEGGELTLVSTSGRHETGSYFTPELVVDRIVERTLEPALAQRSESIAATGLEGDDVLDAFLDVQVLDPAMGSGHFLVSAAAWIAQYIATDPAYEGELSLDEIQRRVAERCIYGVDANPMAVELARLSLWLATARHGQPLTFLANLRVGNTLVGATLEELLAGGDTLFAERLARDAEAILDQLEAVAARDSSAGEDVHEKERLAAAAEALRDPLERHADEQVASRFQELQPRPLHWALEFPDVFLAPDGRPLTGGGFDAVIGNPPYVRIQETGRELAAWCRSRFETASGSFDTYVPFIEQGVGLLGPSGRLGFIVPSRFLKADYGQKLREWLTEAGLLEEVVDFGDAQLFPGATNYTCILVLGRGGGELTYRRVGREPLDLRRALASLDSVPAATFPREELGADPWVLATGEEAELLRALRQGAERLDEVTAQIFQGLITSADPVYILEDRGRRGDRRIAYSRASEREVELEADLLHPLASGVDVERHAFRPLRSLLLFPYRRDGDEMRLLDPAELRELSLTSDYLAEHEAILRAREGERMDNEGWYAFGRTQSLGAHDLPKLGVAATVKNLEVAPDPGGDVYFHNVRVNGILEEEGGPSIWLLSLLLNSRPVDWVFRRLSVPHANGYFAANKQFIAPLPIRLPDADAEAQLVELSQRLHERSAAVLVERRGFLDWLEGELGVRVSELDGSTAVAAYDELTLDELLDRLRANRRRVTAEVEGRAFRERMAAERAESLDRLTELRRALGDDESAAEAAVAELYGLSEVQRQLMDGDYA